MKKGTRQKLGHDVWAKLEFQCFTGNNCSKYKELTTPRKEFNQGLNNKGFYSLKTAGKILYFQNLRFLSRQGIQIKCQQASHAPSRYGDKQLFGELKKTEYEPKTQMCYFYF